MSRVASTVMPAVCGTRDDVVEDEQRVGGSRRLVVEHVEAGARDRTAHERVVKRRLVVHRSPRGRDEERRRLHRGELLASDQALGLRRQRAGELHEVGPFEQLVEVDLRSPRERRPRSSERYGSKASTVHCERRAQLDQSGRRSAPSPTMPSVLPSSWLPRSAHAVLHDLAPDHAVGERDLLGQVEHEAECVLGDRLATGSGVVAHRSRRRAVHASTSMTSYPAPAEHTASRSGQRSSSAGPPATARPRRDCGPRRCG